jgi:thymidylate synthase ThyX
MSKDMVKRPDHYCFSKFEPKDVIREWGLNFNLGSAVKYIARAGRKDDIVQDLKKAREFLSFEIEALEAERGVTEEAKPEDRYLCLLEWGASPQEARAVLPNSLKTEIVVTANLREWRNIFKLRAVGVTGKPHPQMLEVMVPLLEEVKKQIPVVFDDLVTE